MSSAEKSEQPTARRLREARRKGQVAIGRDLASALAFLGAIAAVMATSERARAHLERAITAGIREAASATDLDASTAAAHLYDALALALDLSLLPAIAALACGALLLSVEARGLVAVSLLVPKGERIDPLKGLKRLVGLRTAVELAKGWLRLAATASAALVATGAHAREMVAAAASGEAPFAIAALVVRDAALGTAAALVALGAADLAIQRRLHLRELRMSKDEVRRDHKEEDGDPLLKSVRKQTHREILTAPMLAATRTATAVVVNPTHVAAALAYDAAVDNAPRVVAKGSGRTARAIRRTAEWSGVCVVENRPLARALLLVPVGAEIPESIFEAVAEVIAALDEAGVTTSASEAVRSAT